MGMKVEMPKKEKGEYVSMVATIKCGNCLLEEQFPVNELTEPVDVYGDLIDAFYGNDPREEQGFMGMGNDLETPEIPLKVENIEEENDDTTRSDARDVGEDKGSNGESGGKEKADDALVDDDWDDEGIDEEELEVDSIDFDNLDDY